MTLHIELPPETERRLLERAAALGKDVSALVVEALEQTYPIDSSEVSDVPAPSSQASPSEWAEQLRQWIAGFPRVTHVVDDSRESIYEGRDQI